MNPGRRTAIVVGAGQAGLAMSHCLTRRGIDHVVLERGRIGGEWRDRRWDSFCLVTPNWQCQLPGFPYQGSDPHGFMVRDDIVAYLEDYVGSFDPPVHEGVTAQRLKVVRDGTFQLSTSHGEWTAEHVIVATGPYQVPLVPRVGERIPDYVRQIHSSDYRNPAQLPDGPVLVVGTGQSGCQIAEDLHLAGRKVHLAVGGAPRVARRYRGRDVVDWLADMGYYRRSIDEFADAEAVRLRANHYVTGRDGGHDIDLRQFAHEGMRLHGRLSDIHDGRLYFADDLTANLDNADNVSESIKDSVDKYLALKQIEAPTEARYVPVWQPPDGASELDVDEVAAVVWATGFGRDDRWIDVPVFNGKGYPMHRRGVTPQQGLYFLGLPWQWTWGSGRFCGVATDAEYLTNHVAIGRTDRHVFEVPWLDGTAVA
jgi:putative flavoprotein involved in K+ transport